MLCLKLIQSTTGARLSRSRVSHAHSERTKNSQDKKKQLPNCSETDRRISKKQTKKKNCAENIKLQKSQFIVNKIKETKVSQEYSNICSSIETLTKMESDNKKPFKVKDITRNIKKAVVAGSLEEIRSKVSEKFEKTTEFPTIHLDSDGTEIDDEEYFRTLEANTELIAVFEGEHWIDPSHYVTITTPHDQTDAADKAEKTARIKQLVGQLQNNLCNVSVMSDPDLDSLSNMDPNSLVDITGKDFMDQLKDSGRPLCAKRNAEDRINLLKLLKDGAIFCSERYPEDAEAIDAEIRRQLNDEIHNNHNNTMTIEQVQTETTTTTTTGAATATRKTVAALIKQQQQQQHQEQTITIVVTDTNLTNDNNTTTKATKTKTLTNTGNNKSHDI